MPFWAGTYFPPEPRQGMPGWAQVLTAIGAAWDEQREEIRSQAGGIVERLRGAAALKPPEEEIDPASLDAAVAGLRKLYDAEHGGFGTAPKFPPTSAIEFLLGRGEREMALHTLRRMASGGMYDQVGGAARRQVRPRPATRAAAVGRARGRAGAHARTKTSAGRPSVEGAIARCPRIASVRPARRISQSSMQSAPSNIAWISDSTLRPGRDAPGRPPEPDRRVDERLDPQPPTECHREHETGVDDDPLIIEDHRGSVRQIVHHASDLLVQARRRRNRQLSACSGGHFTSTPGRTPPAQTVDRG